MGIPRLIYLARTLNLCFFPVFTVVVGDIVLLAVPQAKEALFAFNDDDVHFHSLEIAFEIAFLTWMIAAWYVARLLLGKRFEPDLIGTCSHPRFAKVVVDYLPRCLAPGASLPLAVFMIRRASLHALGIVSACFSILVFFLLVLRRRLGKNQKWRAKWSARESEIIERFDDISGTGWAFIIFLFTLSFLLCLSLPWGMDKIARLLGAPALLLFALMSWTIFGGFILTYLPRSLGSPAVTWVAALFLVLFYQSNENHIVAPPAEHIRNSASRPNLETTFVDWLKHRANPSAPVIFVASAGGASRAAYWTTASLGQLEDEARGNPSAQNPHGRQNTPTSNAETDPPTREVPKAFADNIFVISGISGGSLGAAAFVSTLQVTRNSAVSDCKSVRNVGNGFTGRDDLSTVVGLMLFPDLLQRFLPVAIPKWDRSRGLEEVWTSDWNDVLTQCGLDHTLSNPWGQAFTSVHASQTARSRLPLLVLNSTAIHAGQAVLQADFTLERSDTFDLLCDGLRTQSLTLAQAVHNSARFPYISPAGEVVQLKSSCGGGSQDQVKTGTLWDRLGDGGYVESSGALTLVQILQELTDHRLIQDVDSPGPCKSPDATATDCYISKGQVRILVLDNTPIKGPALLCGLQKKGAALGVRPPQPQNALATAPAFIPPGPDFLGPLLGAFATRGGRAAGAQVDLLNFVDGCNAQFAELRFPKPPKSAPEPSMDWMLDETSRKQIDAVLLDIDKIDANSSLARVALHQNLNIVRSWFAPASPTN